MQIKYKTTTKKFGNQKGIVLPIVLIFLLIMMILGLTSIRNVTLEEKMAGNSSYQQIAFHAAEQALRECERDVMDPAKPKYFGDQIALGMNEVPKITDGNLVTTEGTYWDPSSALNKWGSSYRYDVENKVNRYNKIVTLTGSANGVVTAKCMVERLEASKTKQPGTLAHCPFRVTARVDDAARSSGIAVMLQSYLIAPLNSKNVCSS